MRNTFLKEKETRKALANFILKTDKLSMGPKCLEFEVKFAKWQGRKQAILFNSGSSANLALLQALKNLGYLINGDRIGFSALTWATNVMPIIQLGFEPVAIDCYHNTLNIESELPELDALFVTNALGWAPDLDRIKRTCEYRKVILLEDNCESLGTVLKRRTGNYGLAATFSFFVAHHMSTIEGGMVCTDNAELADMLRIVRSNGWDRNLSPKSQKRLRELEGVKSEFDSKYSFYDLAYNFRPTEITGFLGLSQLKYLDSNIKKRQRNYLKAEKVIKTNPDLVALKRDHIKTLSPFCLPIICRTPALAEVYRARFRAAGIEIRPMIAGNIIRQPFYRNRFVYAPKLPGADFIHQNGFYCGNYPDLTQSELATIISCLKFKK